MRNFAIGLLLLNLVYFAWNMGFLPGKTESETAVIRSPSQQAPKSLVLVSELEEISLLEDSLGDDLEDGLVELGIANTEDSIQALEASVAQFPEDIGGEVANNNASACMAIGAFANLTIARTLVTEITEKGFLADIELQKQTESEYRVYMPPFSSDAAARQTLANLLENGIDSFIINSGDLGGAISLGLFQQQQSAFRLQEELAAEGYATSIQETVQSDTEFWIIIQPASSSDLEVLWTGLLESNRNIKQSEKLCESVAPEGLLP